MSKAKRSALTRSKSKNYDRLTVMDDVYLYKKIIDKPGSDYSIHYEVECSRFTNLSFTLDMSESKNIKLYRYDETLKDHENQVFTLSLTVKVKPFSTVYLGYSKVADEHKDSTFMMSCKCREEKPDETEVQRYLSNHRTEMEKRLTEANHIQFPSERDDEDGSTVIKICQTHDVSFIDLAFPPVQTSIFVPSQLAKLTPERKKEFKQIEWKRPIAFMKPSSKDSDVLMIHVFENGIEAADILQGGLGDCWFLSSLAALAEYPKLIEALFPIFSREYHESGVYFVRFCKNGLWTSVRVDDYIPCYPGSGPIFSKSHGNELWVMLVEKAYAKLHGCYLGIQSGQSYEALLDLTGAPYHTIDFPATMEQKNDISLMNSLWNQLVDGLKNHYIMSASTRSRDAVLSNKNEATAGTFHNWQEVNEIGLVFNHCYTIFSVKETSKGDRIVKLRYETAFSCRHLSYVFFFLFFSCFC
jgi:hypothetical protein